MPGAIGFGGNNHHFYLGIGPLALIIPAVTWLFNWIMRERDANAPQGLNDAQARQRATNLFITRAVAGCLLVYVITLFLF